MSAPIFPPYRKSFDQIYPFWGRPLLDKVKLVAKEVFIIIAAVALDRLYPLIFVPAVVIGFVFNDHWLRKEFKASLLNPLASLSTVSLLYQSKIHWAKKALLIVAVALLALFKQEWILPLGCLALGIWCGRRLENLYYATQHGLHAAGV